MVSQPFQEKPLTEPNASFLDWLSRVTYIFPEGDHRVGRSVYLVVPAHAFFFYLFFEEVRHNLNNFEDLADTLQFLCVFSITWHKWMVMLAKPRLFMKLAAIVKNNFGMPEQIKDPTYSIILKKYWNELKVFRILWIMMIFFPAIGIAVLPAVKILRMQNSYRKYNATGNETDPLEYDIPSFPFHNWTPYDEVSEPWYSLIYLENILIELMTYLMLIVYDNFFFTFVHSASAQFKIIQASLEELRARSVAAVRLRRGAARGGGAQTKAQVQAEAEVLEEEWEKEEVDVEMRRRLRCIARHHDLVYRFVDDVESFANTVLLNQFGSSSIICCMAAFNVASNPSLDVRILTCACVFGAAVFELGIYCAVGDHLMDQSLQVDFAAYSSEWYRSSVRIRREISIIKMRARRCAKITFGKFSPLNLESYASIMHVIYSYYTMLTGVNKTGEK